MEHEESLSWYEILIVGIVLGLAIIGGVDIARWAATSPWKDKSLPEIVGTKAHEYKSCDDTIETRRKEYHEALFERTKTAKHYIIKNEGASLKLYYFLLNTEPPECHSIRFGLACYRDDNKEEFAAYELDPTTSSTKKFVTFCAKVADNEKETRKNIEEAFGKAEALEIRLKNAEKVRDTYRLTQNATTTRGIWFDPSP